MISKEVSSKLLHWIPRVIVAFILAQTLFFKFTGAQESVNIFSALGMEPGGRIGIGILELITVVLLMTRFYLFGAIISLSVISAANFLHFAKLGIEVNDDGGALFVMSIVVIVLSLWIVYYWNLVRSKPKKIIIAPSQEQDIDLIEE